MLGLPAGLLGGQAPLVRFERRVARLLGVGVGFLPALRLLGRLGDGLLVAFQVQLELVAAHPALEVLKRAAVNEMAPAQHSRVIADLVDVAEIVAGNDERLFLGQRLDQVEHAAAGLRIEAVRRLVPDEQVRLVDEAGGDREVVGLGRAVLA